MGVLEKFIPLLHLHNHNKVELRQDNHFGEIRIHKAEGEVEE
jgi:chromatin segregation and condensation protein Rec8/ScpA/Scc1 (kleisin family)